jgi:peroxidase
LLLTVVELHGNLWKQGCDGSVLLDDTFSLKGEKKASTNINSLDGFRIIDRIKNNLESECPGTVSCADILTIAARDAVILVPRIVSSSQKINCKVLFNYFLPFLIVFALQVGGPYWDVPLGRKDSITASPELAETNLPAPNEGLLSIISKFLYQGLSVTDMVALSGT